MPIYSFHSYTDPDGKQNEVIHSPELDQLPVTPELYELAALRALTPAGLPGEMMSYLLSRNGYSVFGLSYSEKQTLSGTTREAPCSLQYVASETETAAASADLGRIVNFINFQKPPATSPAPLDGWPMIDSGYTFHNSTAVLTSLVDGLARVAAQDSETVLLIGLPKEKKNAYAFARYTIAEMLEYLPESMRTNVRFFTGLPVAGKVTEPGTGFDTAVHYGANVICCPAEYFRQIRLYRKCISVDMDHPSGGTGEFANYITHAPGTSASLAAVSGLVSGGMTYEALNEAAKQVKEGRTGSDADRLRHEISIKDQQIRTLGQQIENGNREYRELRNAYAAMKAQPREPARTDGEAETEAPGLGKKILKRILTWLVLLVVLGVGIYAGSTMIQADQETARKKQELKAQEEQLAGREKKLETSEDRLNKDRAGLTEREAVLDMDRAALEEEKQGLSGDRTALEKEKQGLAEDRAALEEQKEQLSVAADRASAMTGVRRAIASDLADAFAREGISVPVDNDGTIVLDSALFFDTGNAVIRAEGREMLNRIIPVYLGVLLQDQYVDYLGEISIECHTDSTGTFNNNLMLSQDRALVIALYCLDIPSVAEEQRQELMRMITAKGRSYARLVFDSNGLEDPDASRRVEIRFQLRDAEIIEELNRILGYENADSDIRRNDQGYMNEEPVNLYAMTNANALNIREKTSTTAKVLVRLKRGTALWVIGEVSGEDNDELWYHIWIQSGDKWREGYVMAQYADLMPEEESRLYLEEHPVIPLNN